MEKIIKFNKTKRNNNKNRNNNVNNNYRNEVNNIMNNFNNMNMNNFNNMNMNNFNNIDNNITNNVVDNANYFEVKTTKRQTFIIKEYEDKYNYNFQIMNKGTLPCVLILIPKNRNTASLQSVSYHPNCCKESLSRGDGTKYMLQFALKYIIKKYPHITKIHISDTTSYELNNGDISLITPRYLLTGEKGYYEKTLNAYPIKNTIEIIETINKNMKTIKELIPKNITNDWWTPENVDKITNSVYPEILTSKISYTDWEVSKDIINSYDINWEVTPIEKPFHGGKRILYEENMRAKYMKKIIKYQKV